MGFPRQPWRSTTIVELQVVSNLLLILQHSKTVCYQKARRAPFLPSAAGFLLPATHSVAAATASCRQPGARPGGAASRPCSVPKTSSLFLRQLKGKQSISIFSTTKALEKKICIHFGNVAGNKMQIGGSAGVKRLPECQKKSWNSYSELYKTRFFEVIYLNL